MNQQKVYKLNSTGRRCYLFPWESKSLQAPWKAGYTRVVIPLSAAERRSAKPGTKCHIQIVRSSRISEVKQKRLVLQA